MGIVIMIILFIIIIVIGIAIGNLKNRATQTVLKNTPFSSSAINGATEDLLSKRAKNKFYEEYGNIYTEESLKEYFKKVGDNLIKQESMKEFSEKVNEKMSKDAKLQKLQQAQFKKFCIMSYSRNILTIFITYDTGRDEYRISINSTVDSNGISKIQNYMIQKGVATGF